ncbi:MAG: hypothetical protein Q4D98_09115 [Planctomycetia bacterium]|nr:hypothetical protein [Planctomycetia bacterium]
MSAFVSREGANFGGGAIYTHSNNNVTLSGTTFTNNSVVNQKTGTTTDDRSYGDSGGGAIAIMADESNSNLILQNTNLFSGNSATIAYTSNTTFGNGGGAIAIVTTATNAISTLEMDPTSNNTFSGNYVKLDAARTYGTGGGASGGGAIYGSSQVVVKIDGTNDFSGNYVLYENTGRLAYSGSYNSTASVGGGAICSANRRYDTTEATDKLFIRGNNTFTDNYVHNIYGTTVPSEVVSGGAIYGEEIRFYGNGSVATFTGNHTPFRQ